jgi:hypothetical protein
MPKPWEIQCSECGRETSKGYFAFCLYRDMPPDQRSLSQVTAILRERREASGRSRLGRAAATPQSPAATRPSRQVAEWARRWRWVERAAAWDSEQERIKSDARLAELEEMTKRHVVQLKAAMQAVLVPSAAIARKLRDNPQAERELTARPLAELLKLAEVMRFLPALQTAERQARAVHPPRKPTLDSAAANHTSLPVPEIMGAEFTWVQSRCLCGHTHSVHDQEHENPAMMPCTIAGCGCEKFSDADEAEANGRTGAQRESDSRSRNSTSHRRRNTRTA